MFLIYDLFTSKEDNSAASNDLSNLFSINHISFNY